MSGIRLRVCVTAVLLCGGVAACGPVPVDQAEDQCFTPALQARNPLTGTNIGMGSEGLTGELELTVTSDFVQGRDPAGHLGFDLPLQIDIVLVLGQLAIKLAAVDAQQSGQPELLLGCRDDIVGVCPDRLGRQTAGQHRARAIDDLAADRRNLEVALVA